MENMEWNKIRRQSLFKVLPPKLLPVTKNFPTPSEFLLRNNLSDRIDNIEMSQKVLQPIPILVTTKIQKTSKDFKKSWKSKQGVRQKQPNNMLQQPPKTTTVVWMIAISQDKLICNKVGTATISKFQQEIIAILKRDIRNFRGGNL